jgi:RNA polymerase sigma-70 factor, ECF subfamily
MSVIHAESEDPDELDLVDAARRGDAQAFGLLARRYGAELRLHCYRMLGSASDAEDVVQDTFARAWRSRETFERRGDRSYRSWLYRIATNCCLDELRKRRRRVLPPAVIAPSLATEPPPAAEVDGPWVEPYPDRHLPVSHEHAQSLDDLLAARETVELVFIAAIQHLTPRQRCVLIARDVLDWSAAESAALLDISVAAVNSALQRARARLREHLPPDRMRWSRSTSARADDRALVDAYMRAIEARDHDSIRTLLHEDAAASFPPRPLWYQGRESVADGTHRWAAPGDYRCVATRANLQPAVAIYLRAPDDVHFRPLALEVLTIRDGRLAEIVDFGSPELFATFALPAQL